MIRRRKRRGRQKIEWQVGWLMSTEDVMMTFELD